MKEKKYLIELTMAVIAYSNGMDKIMKDPESYNRGKAIAKLMNYLELKNDAVMYFGLDLSFKKIDNLKKRNRERKE